MYCNVPVCKLKEKKYEQIFFAFTEERSRIRSWIQIWIHYSEVRILGSGSAPKCHGSPTLEGSVTNTGPAWSNPEKGERKWSRKITAQKVRRPSKTFLQNSLLFSIGFSYPKVIGLKTNKKGALSLTFLLIFGPSCLPRKF